ncbi:MAG TPA: SAM-dependent methyltransferase [Actinomycetota bacterium]|nr:SAM-dependent methyltransferase [Actinomycetota bacterium]
MDRATGPRRGSLAVVGAGIKLGLHLTQETRGRIQRADDVLYLLSEIAPTSWIHTLNPAARSMIDIYQPGRDQREVYEELVETALGCVRRGRDVCMVTYGNPAVFDDSCHEAVRRAREEGYEAEMLPAVSAIDCLFVDLGVDPGRYGLQLFEATDFLDSEQTPDTAVPLVLWQISVIGTTRTTDTVDREGLRRLAARLSDLYGDDHEVIVYEATPFPVGRPTIEHVPIAELPHAPVPGLSSLYVPPLER